MLYLIGLGLRDEKDMPLKALEALQKSAAVYIELYTSRWFGSLEAVEKLAGKPVKEAGREFVESLQIVKEAASRDVALLVPGDPLAATTHFELLAEARKSGVPVKVVHSSSIFTAIAETGLQSYKFGRTTSVTFPRANFNPSSPYETIAENKKAGMHTLVLLDVQPPSYMTIREALEILLKHEDCLGKGVLGRESKVIAAAELGGDPVILYDTIENLIRKDLKKVPAVIVVPGNLNFKEEEALELYK